MANIFLITGRSRRSKSHEGKGSESNSNFESKFSCKKHTKHRQSPGVCALCLTERLSRLSLEYTKTASSFCSSSTSSSTSVSSCYSSSSSSVSSSSSPLQFGSRAEKEDRKKPGFFFRLLLGSIVD